MIATVQNKVSEAASRAAITAAFGTVALVALVVGLGFMTLASWLVLVTVMAPEMAALTLGLFYLGLALLMLVVIAVRKNVHQSELSHPAPKHQAANPQEATLATVLNAFTTGVSAGREARP